MTPNWRKEHERVCEAALDLIDAMIQEDWKSLSGDRATAHDKYKRLRGIVLEGCDLQHKTPDEPKTIRDAAANLYR